MSSWKWRAIAALALGAGVAHAQTAEELLKKEADSVAARRLAIEAFYSDFRGPAEPFVTEPNEVIYGADDRIEVWQETNARVRQIAESACVVVFRSEITNLGNGTYRLGTSPWNSQSGAPVCTDEPFRGQPTIGFCSGFLVGTDLITTAGHCVDASDVANVAFVFNFEIDAQGGAAPSIVSADDVYFPTAIVNQQLSGGFDHSVVRVDRPVVGRQPIPVRRTGIVSNGDPLVVIGHPTTLPKKISAGATVQNNQGTGTPWFQSNLDTYGGNSGSMVVNLNTFEIEGILVRGAPDYVTSGGCTRSNRVPDTGNTGGGLRFEEVSKTTGFSQFIPALGLTVATTDSTTHIGPVAGPFSPSTVSYTLNNTTASPLNYSVTSAGAAFLTLGGTLNGTLPANGSAVLTATLNAAATSAPAGVLTQDLTFNDLTNGRSTTSTHTLEVGQAVINVSAGDVIASGPVGGPFIGAQQFSVTSQRPTPAQVQVTTSQPWMTLNGASGPLTFTLNSNGASQGVNVAIGGTAGSLPAGIYTGLVTFTNLTAGTSTTRNVTLEIGRLVYTASDTPAPITDNSTTTSTLAIADSGCIADLEVDLDITHTFRGDLVVELRSPAGDTVRLHNRTGGSADDLVARYGVNDTAPDGPGSITDFNGNAPTGTWTLIVRDEAGGDEGTLNAWSLRIASTTGCPPVALDGTLAVPGNAVATATLNASVPSGGPGFYEILSFPTKGVLWDTNAPGGPDSILTIPGALTTNTVLYRANIDAIGTDSFTYRVTDNGLVSNTATVTITIGGTAPIFTANMDTSPAGWTFGQGWAHGQPTGQGGDPFAGFTGNNVVGYNLAGAYENNINTTRFLTTAPFDLTGRTGVSISFRRWNGLESATFDDAIVQISRDGITWTDLWVHTGGTFQDTAWALDTYNTPTLDNAPAARVRWGLGPTDGSVVGSGWNIDDFNVLALAATGNPADFGGPAGSPDGLLNIFDIFAYFNAFGSGNPLADVNGDGTLNVFDIFRYFALFGGG